VIKWPVKLYVRFYVFFQNPKNMTFYVFFELLHTFSRTMQPARSVCVSVSAFFILHCDANATVSWVGSIIIIVVVVFINYLRQVGYVFVGVS